jgi:hypothetical protein
MQLQVEISGNVGKSKKKRDINSEREKTIGNRVHFFTSSALENGGDDQEVGVIVDLGSRFCTSTVESSVGLMPLTSHILYRFSAFGSLLVLVVSHRQLEGKFTLIHAVVLPDIAVGDCQLFIQLITCFGRL